MLAAKIMSPRPVSHPRANVLTEAHELLKSLGGKKEHEARLKEMKEVQEHNEAVYKQANDTVNAARDATNQANEAQRRAEAAKQSGEAKLTEAKATFEAWKRSEEASLQAKWSAYNQAKADIDNRLAAVQARESDALYKERMNAGALQSMKQYEEELDERKADLDAREAAVKEAARSLIDPVKRLMEK